MDSEWYVIIDNFNVIAFFNIITTIQAFFFYITLKKAQFSEDWQIAFLFAIIAD